MGANTKRIIFSNIANWHNGWGHGLKFVNDYLQIDTSRNSNKVYEAVYISTSLDSLEEDTIWHRLYLDRYIPVDANIYVSYFASNYKIIDFQGEEVDLDDLICSNAIGAQAKEKFLQQFWVDTVVNPSDMLLHKARGRYLWLRIVLISYSRESPSISKLQVEFPLDTIVSLLPEIYQHKESFDLLSRFLGIFQSLIYDLDKRIEDIAFDPEIVDIEFVHWLAKWFAIENVYVWSETKLKYLIKNAYRLYKIKGTKQSIEEIVELYTGQKPLIVESFEMEEFADNYELTKLYQNLYGDNAYTFTVLVDEAGIPTSQKFIELKQVIERFKPAHSIVRIVVLKPYLFLDNYTYIGLNSLLSGSNKLILDGRAIIPFDTRL